MTKLSTLFKFRSVDDYTLDSLRKSYVYFSNPTKFNDPFELQAFLDQTSDLDALKMQFLQDMKTEIIGSTDAQNEERWEHEEWRGAFLKAIKSVDKLDKDLLETLPIFCASATRESILLWSHYASNHEGIAIGLDPNQDKFLRNSQEVIYSNDYPVIDMIRDGPDQMRKKLILTKAVDWTYEQEYRAIHPRVARSVTHTIPTAAFVSITFGAKISEENKRAVESASRNLRNVRFEQARLGERTFSIQFSDLA